MKYFEQNFHLMIVLNYLLIISLVIKNARNIMQAFVCYQIFKLNYNILKMKQQLKQYKQKVNDQKILYEKLFCQLKDKISKQLDIQVTKKCQKFKEMFYKQKQDLSKENESLKYYSNKYQQSLKNQNGFQDLSPLYKIVDHKLAKNQKLINSFQCKIDYPHNSKQSISLQKLQIQKYLLQNQLNQIKKIIFYNPSIKKYIKKQLAQIQAIHINYQKLFQASTQVIYTPLLKLKASIGEVSSNLLTYKNIQAIDASIKQPNGIITLDDYKKLAKGISMHQNIISKVQIKLTDMQFSQQKCDILKYSIKQCKHLSNIKIQNYYKQCKLGYFQDFNWLPFKKQTHIIGKIW